MADNKIDSMVAGENTKEAFSVDAQGTDGATGISEITWQDNFFSKAMGYYKDEKTPEITSVIDTGSNWVAGKGYTADEETTMILDTIKGNGFDTFNSLMENLERTKELGGNAYAEIIRDDEENLINLKPLDPATMKHHASPKGVITHFTKTSKTNTDNKRYTADKIFYIARNRIADEIHGTGIASKLKLIIDMKNEAMADQRIAMHLNVVPRWKFKLKTDNPAEITAYKAKMDKATGLNQNIYEPFDVSESELISVPPNSTLNPMAWIQYLDDLFYQVGGVPKIIIGGTGGFTEQAVTITYLAFQQNIEKRQLYWEEQILAQLNLVIHLVKPASVENNLLTDKQKDGDMNIDSSETTAGQNQ